MDYLENEFNKRFKNQELPNDQFETEDLWNEITGDLDEEKSISKGSFLNGRNLLLFVFLAFCLGGATLLIEDSDGSSSLDPSSESLQTNSIETESDLSQVKTSLSANESEEVAGASSFSSTENEEDDEVSSLSANDNRVDMEQNDASGNEGNNLSRTASGENIEGTNRDEQFVDVKKSISKIREETFEQATTNQQPNIIENEIKHPQTISIDGLKNSQKESKSELKNDNKSLTESSHESKNELTAEILNQHLEFLPLIENSFINSASKSNDKFELPIFIDTLWNSDDLKEEEEAKSFFITGLAGVNAIDYNFSSNEYSEIANLKNDSEKLFLGISYALYGGVRFNEWTLSSGIEYHNLWSEFDYTSTKSITVPGEFQLIKTYKDANTGETILDIYGTPQVDATETRTVRDYNNVKSFSLPILLGYQKEKEKLSIGLDIGPVINYAFFQSGKTHSLEENIIEFDGENLFSPSPTLDISFLVSPSFGISVFNNCHLVLNPQWRGSRNDYLEFTDFKIGKSQWNFNIGLRYEID